MYVIHTCVYTITHITHVHIQGAQRALWAYLGGSMYTHASDSVCMCKPYTYMHIQYHIWHMFTYTHTVSTKATLRAHTHIYIYIHAVHTQCICAPPKRGRYWEIQPWIPRDFPRPERFSSVEGNLKGGGDGFPNTSPVLLEYGHSPPHQFICRDGSGNPSLWAGKDWQC